MLHPIFHILFYYCLYLNPCRPKFPIIALYILFTNGHGLNLEVLPRRLKDTKKTPSPLKMRSNKPLSSSLYILLISVFGLLSCESKIRDAGQTSEIPTIEPGTLANMTGAELAKIYCSSCHLFPTPTRLDRATWAKKVLPEMAHRLGIKDTLTDPFQGVPTQEALLMSHAYPKTPLVDSISWQKIVEYYVQSSPDTIANQIPKAKINTHLLPFVAEPLKPEIWGGPLTTIIQQDKSDQSLFIANATNQALLYKPQQGFYDHFETASPVVNYHRDRHGGILLLMIGIIFPTEQKTGQLVYRDQSGQETVCIEQLPRPVHANYSDLNQDGLEDVIICSYGNYTGRLSWWENKGDCKYEEHLILNQAGALKTIVIDWNKDGLPDILSLFGQGKEGIYIHYNKGSKGFETEPILQFDPVNGSTYFELADFDGDRHLDILYTNGDNADYSYSLKPYHGIRIFKNNGENQFKESFFYPFYGAFKALAYDFDQDGDLDVASISFFPDYSHDSPESFVYLENLSSDGQPFPSFQAHTFPDANQGRWLVMDKGDLNGDGAEDIFLGSFIFSPTPVPDQYMNRWKEEGVHGLILWNKGKQ